MTNHKIAVIGSGAWGCAIASVLANNNHKIALFTNDDAVTKEINNNNISPFLPTITLSKRITAYSDLITTVTNAKFIFIIIPSIVVLEVLQNAKDSIAKDAILIICSKGIEDHSCKLFSQICEEVLPNNQYGILSGPNFAVEVAMKLPTVTTIAAKDKNVATQIIDLLENNYFKPTAIGDVITVQIIGTVKNILAIGCGIIDGLELGKNAQSALLVKGIDEIISLAEKLGGKAQTLISAAGFGDIFLTCSSTKSRNNSFGLLIGKGQKAQDILNNSNTTYEGVSSAKSVITLANKNNVKLPLCQAIYDILYKDTAISDVKEIIYKAILMD